MRFDDLPPLAFLPTLEAAGRLGSFKAAADELHVTPSAVSQQVKAVEDALGSALFERRGRTVLLTLDGERYLREVRQSLRILENAGRRLRNSRDRNVLRLDTVPFVAHEFLLPRLSQLRARGHQERGIANALTGMGIPVDPSRVHSFESYFEAVRAAVPDELSPAFQMRSR